MKKSLTIAELIHARVVAEGGTLHVWLDGAKFRRVVDHRKNVDGETVDQNVEINDLGRVMSVNDATDDEVMDGLAPFVPSDILRDLIIRNRFEVSDYLQGKVKDWRKMNGFVD